MIDTDSVKITQEDIASYERDGVVASVAHDPGMDRPAAKWSWGANRSPGPRMTKDESKGGRYIYGNVYVDTKGGLSSSL